MIYQDASQLLRALLFLGTANALRIREIDPLAL
jgi:hypothetical protein